MFEKSNVNLVAYPPSLLLRCPFITLVPFLTIILRKPQVGSGVVGAGLLNETFPSSSLPPEGLRLNQSRSPNRPPNIHVFCLAQIERSYCQRLVSFRERVELLTKIERFFRLQET
jgi:hypothetical protein